MDTQTPPWIEKFHPDSEGHEEFCYCARDDVLTAFEEAKRDTYTLGEGAAEATPITPDDVAEVLAEHVSYGGMAWDNAGGGGGTELSLAMVFRLKDGRFASLYAWNDYTGWGCQDGSSVRVGDSYDEVIRFGLDDEERRLLNIEP